MPSMLTSVAFVVCQVSVVDLPASIAFGLADREAVGAASEGGGGGGGGATFLAHAARKMMVPSANARVRHLVNAIDIDVVIDVVTVIVIVVARFTDSSFLCARLVACHLQIHGRAHSGPAAKTVSC